MLALVFVIMSKLPNMYNIFSYSCMGALFLRLFYEAGLN